MADWSGETNGHPYRSSKICPVLTYVVSMAVLDQYLSGGNSSSKQWWVPPELAVSSINDKLVGGLDPPACPSP